VGKDKVFAVKGNFEIAAVDLNGKEVCSENVYGNKSDSLIT